MAAQNISNKKSTTTPHDNQAYDPCPTVPSEVVDICIDQKVSWLAAWRLYRGLTQANVAKKIGYGQSTYSRIERANKPCRDDLKKFEMIFDTDCNALIDLYYGED